MSVEELLLKKRSASTRGENNVLRKNGEVPGILYGLSNEAQKISINEVALMKTLTSGSASRVFALNLEENHLRAVIKEVQFDPVTDRPIHVDFMQVTKGSKINIKVKIRFLNENLSPAVKKGGVLNAAIHDALLSCDIDNVPESLDFDVSGMDFHHAVKVSDLKLPEGARFVNLTPDLTVATIVAPSGLRSEFGKEAEAAAKTEAAASEEKK